MSETIMNLTSRFTYFRHSWVINSIHMNTFWSLKLKKDKVLVEPSDANQTFLHFQQTMTLNFHGYASMEQTKTSL